jgi:hypothetical protein
MVETYVAWGGDMIIIPLTACNILDDIFYIFNHMIEISMYWSNCGRINPSRRQKLGSEIHRLLE